MTKKVERGVLYFPGKGGGVYGVLPLNGKKFSYEELSTAVGGMVESVVPKERGHTVFANEEGVLQGLEGNGYTWEVVNKAVYLLNGYGSDWRLAGRVLQVFKVTKDAISFSDVGRRFISEVVKP